MNAPATHDPLELHFRRMAEYPLLTRADELALARRLERADHAITRALLASTEGRQCLLEVATALRMSEARAEDVERNPGEDIAERIEKAVQKASAKKRRDPAKPGTTSLRVGLRLHPRTVLAIERDLVELAARAPKNAALRKTLRSVERWRREGEQVTAEFVQANLRIVVTFARRYHGMAPIDLIQEGNLGLLRAVDKYDHRRGLRFSTYAAWWIRHALGRAVADQSRMIRIPVHLTGTMRRVRRAQDRLHRETGVEPSIQELAKRTGVAVEQVRRALDVVAQPISLDMPSSNRCGDREGTEIGDFVPDLSIAAADEVVAASELQSETRKLLAELPEREAEIIRLRYGVGGGAQRTLEEIGKRFSLSRERARQLERDALRKLRVASEKRCLHAHLADF